MECNCHNHPGENQPDEGERDSEHFRASFRRAEVTLPNRRRVDKCMIQGIESRPSLDPADAQSDQGNQEQEADKHRTRIDEVGDKHLHEAEREIHLLVPLLSSSSNKLRGIGHVCLRLSAQDEVGRSATHYKCRGNSM